MLISRDISIPYSEIEMRGVRAQGAGGQNINKVSCAIHLRFDIKSSSLPSDFKSRLLRLVGHHLTHEGVIIIKAQRYRTQERNRVDALARLLELLRSANLNQKKRIPTRPTRGSIERRIRAKSLRGKLKQARGNILDK